MYIPWWAIIAAFVAVPYIIVVFQGRHSDRIMKAKEALEEIRDKLEEDGIHPGTAEEAMDALNEVIDGLDS